MTARNQPDLFDLVIIGGGINGCGIARDAAGRGWSVLLCEQEDLASATSSASTKLIHGGLRYLEYYAFRLVREALSEREVLWAIAPHIIHPLRFVLPHHRGLRPVWLLRLGLFLYDHLGGRRLLPPTRLIRLHRDPAGEPLREGFALGFEYSDCRVEDARLTVLNARDAADKGATVLTRTACIGARADGEHWLVQLREAGSGAEREVRARVLVNATGPWVDRTLGRIGAAPKRSSIRLVQGSHIVVPRLYAHDRCYIFQNEDGRIVFAIPFEHDFTLIGTTDRDYHGDPATVRATPDEIAYLCAAASGYFRVPVTEGMVVWSYSGVRPLQDDGTSAAQAATRDYKLELDVAKSRPPLLTVYGGKITTFRRLAEAALATLAPHLPARSGREPGWTGRTALPGGDFPVEGFAAEVAKANARYPFLSEATAVRLVGTYGTRVSELLGDAATLADLGRNFGADLSEAEVRYLIRAEWARSAADILWRRTKLGLRLSTAEVAALDAYMQQAAAA